MSCYFPKLGPEYGTTEAAWKAVLVEADRRGALHNRVKEDLNTKVVTDIKQWQKDTFHKVSSTADLRCIQFTRPVSPKFRSLFMTNVTFDKQTTRSSLKYRVFALQTMMSLKEKKEMDDTFKKAQKPWAKLYQKVHYY